MNTEEIGKLLREVENASRVMNDCLARLRAALIIQVAKEEGAR